MDPMLKDLGATKKWSNALTQCGPHVDPCGDCFETISIRYERHEGLKPRQQLCFQKCLGYSFVFVFLEPSNFEIFGFKFVKPRISKTNSFFKQCGQTLIQTRFGGMAVSQNIIN